MRDVYDVYHDRIASALAQDATPLSASEQVKLTAGSVLIHPEELGATCAVMLGAVLSSLTCAVVDRVLPA